MRIIALFLFATVVPAVSLFTQPQLSYRISPEPATDGLTLTIDVRFSTRGSDSTKLLIPDSYGGQEQFDGIVDIRSLTSGATFQPTPDRAEVWVRHRSVGQVELRYRVREIRSGEVNLGDHYQAVVRPGLIHALGNSLFIVPEWSDSVDVEVVWSGAPSSWKFASSFGVGPGPLRTRQSMDWFLHSIWMAGEIRLRETVVNDRPVAVALHGAWTFSDADLLHLVRSILQTERDFFDDHETPSFLVTALEIGGDNDQGGTGRVNSFGLFLSGDREMDLRLKRLLAHEIFHAWNGDRTERESPEGLVYWFTEGFADYYARRFLLQSGLISPVEYLEDLNANLREYYSSSMRTLPNAALVDGSPGGRDLQRLPYRRGDVLAHILAASGAERGASLDSIVRSYLMTALKGPRVISNATLLRSFAPLLDDEHRPRLEAWVAGTEILDPRRPLFTAGAELDLTERRRYYIVGERLTIPSYRLTGDAPLRP